MLFCSKWRNRVVSDIAVFVLKRDVKLQLTNWRKRWKNWLTEVDLESGD